MIINFIYFFTIHNRDVEVYRGGRFTLGVLVSSCLHSWGLLCTCHFSLWGGTCLCMCERQEAIIKESHTHTHTRDKSHTSLRRKQPLFGGFTLKIYRKGKTTMLQLFYFQLPVSYKAWNEEKKQADFRNCLLRTRDLMQFQISMKATGDIFKACSIWISWRIFIAETKGCKHTGIYTFWDIFPWLLVYRVVSEKS